MPPLPWQPRQVYIQLARCTRTYTPFVGRSSLFYSLALSVAFPPIKSCTRLQAKFPKGAICAAYSFAFALLACRNAYLAAIPCMMTLFRKTPNASPQRDSSCGLHCATSAYQSMHCERVGRPGMEADGAKAGFVWDSSSLDRGWSAKVNGERRFERSESGCPIVDISQLNSVSVDEQGPSMSNLQEFLVALTLGYQLLWAQSGGRPGCQSCNRHESRMTRRLAALLGL